MSLTERATKPLSQAMAVEDCELRRVLFVLNNREWSMFLPPLAKQPLPRTECRWLNTASLEPGVFEQLLDEFNPQVMVTCWSSPAIPVDYLQSPDCALGYVCNITGSVRSAVPRLFLELGGTVSNWGDMAGPQVAEHAILLALGALRRIDAWRGYIQGADGSLRYQCADLNTQTLFNRRVGLHGFGRIARALIELLKPFHVELYGYSANVPEAYFKKHDVTPCRSLNELFSCSEILFECEALTEESEGSVDAGVLACLPDGAVFVNIGRGAVVDEAALRAEAGRLRLALDVVTEEPVDARSPLFRASGVLMSPHIGGPTYDRYRACGEFALANLNAYLGGEAVGSVLDLEAYDRST